MPYMIDSMGRFRRVGGVSKVCGRQGGDGGGNLIEG